MTSNSDAGWTSSIKRRRFYERDHRERLLCKCHCRCAAAGRVDLLRRVSKHTRCATENQKTDVGVDFSAICFSKDNPSNRLASTTVYKRMKHGMCMTSNEYLAVSQRSAGAAAVPASRGPRPRRSQLFLRKARAQERRAAGHARAQRRRVRGQDQRADRFKK